jgi:hypothetical protein
MAEFTGGAMIGWVNVSWPLAKLRVEPEELELKAAFIGTHRFARKDVREVVQVTWLPVLAWGVRVRHVREDVPASVIFWCFGSPKRILDAVSRSGFSPTAMPDARPRAGFPFRVSFVVAALAMWNGLILLDRPWLAKPMLGPGATCAVALAFIASLLIRRHGVVQRAALKSPAALPRVRGFLNLLTLVTGFMLVVSVFMAFGITHR